MATAGSPRIGGRRSDGRRALGLVLAAVTILGVVGACGSSGPAKAAAQTRLPATTRSTAAATTVVKPSSIDPCALVTAAQVTAAIGSPVAPPKADRHGAPLNQADCTWANTDAPPAKTVTLSVVTTSGLDATLRASGESAKKLYDDGRAQSPGAQAVSGLGDAAYVTGSRLEVLKGDVYLTLLTLVTGPTALDALTRLATEALTKL